MSEGAVTAEETSLSQRMAALCLFDESQRHRDDVHPAGRRHGPGGGRDVDPFPGRITGARPADPVGRSLLQCADHRPRADHGLLHGHAGDDRRHGELDGAADDRLTGHGLPPDEQHQLLALGRRRLLPRRLRLRARRAGRWGRRRLDDLPALEFRGRTRRARRRHGDLQPASGGRVLRSSAPSTSSRRFSTCARPA